jgi:predicted methyltransferase
MRTSGFIVGSALLASVAASAALLCALPAAAQSTTLSGAARAPAPTFAEDAVLQAVVSGDWRTEADRSRDVYRHPYEALTFWGLQPGATVVEIGPGGAWWTEILAPYAARTNGTYVAALSDRNDPALTPEQKTQREQGFQRFQTRFSDARYGTIRTVDFGMASGLAVADGSADLILVARAFHNWARSPGLTDRFMGEFARALKPGGYLAVEQHRAPEGSDPAAGTGYVPESYVIEAARKAGLELDARSELNANPKDTRDHPFGVWTLQPVRRSTEGGRTLSEAERAHYDAIGESDRMTLRFRKPG